MNIDKKYQDHALLFFLGPVTVNLISYFGNYLQSFLPPDHKLFQQIFRVFVELTQNVSYYSAEKIKGKNNIDCGKGWFSIQNFSDCYKLSTGNLIKPEDGITLTDYCKEINSLPEEELRTLKREVRAKAFTEDVNARVGLMQICIVSNQKLEFEITEIDPSHSCFIISATICKS